MNTSLCRLLGADDPRTCPSSDSARSEKAADNGTSFGAATEREVEMAELISVIMPSVEMVRMVNSGTEATMSAIRLARAFTGKDKIIKFEGCYHGHADSFLIRAGSGAMTLGRARQPPVYRRQSGQPTLYGPVQRPCIA